MVYNNLHEKARVYMILKILRIKDDVDIDLIKSIVKESARKSENFEELEKKTQYEQKEYNVFFYVYNRSNEIQITWIRDMENILGEELENDSKDFISSYGVMLIYNDELKYAIEFGREITGILSYIDWEFGLDMASKILNSNSLRKQSMKYASTIKNRATLAFFNANFNPRAGESIEKLEGEIIEKKGHTYVRELFNLIKKNVIFQGNMQVDYKRENKSLKDIIQIIYYVDKIREKYKEDNLDIPRVKFLSESKDKELITNLNEKLSNFVINGYQGDDIKLDINNYLSNFQLRTGRKRTEPKDTLEAEDIKKFMLENNISDITKVIVIENGKPYPILEYIDTRIEVEDKMYSLSKGRWVELNRSFIENINLEIANLIKHKSLIIEFDNKFDLNKNKNKQFRKLHPEKFNEKINYGEYEYNIRIAEELGYVVYDRTKFDGIEICDLFDKSKGELIHVKRGSIADFKYCIDQSELGVRKWIELTDKKEFKNINSIALVLLADSSDLLKKKDLLSINSPMFKTKLIEWAQLIIDLNMTPHIIIAKNE